MRTAAWEQERIWGRRRAERGKTKEPRRKRKGLQYGGGEINKESGGESIMNMEGCNGRGLGGNGGVKKRPTPEGFQHEGTGLGSKDTVPCPPLSLALWKKINRITSESIDLPYKAPRDRHSDPGHQYHW